MSTADTPQSAESLRAELAEKEDQLRRLLRLYDQISRTEFRDRAQRLKAMRTQREDLEKEIAALKQHLATHE
jgi:uncharacterized protein involved in exopolysaccharide biosynthesis